MAHRQDGRRQALWLSKAPNEKQSVRAKHNTIPDSSTAVGMYTLDDDATSNDLALIVQ